MIWCDDMILFYRKISNLLNNTQDNIRKYPMPESHNLSNNVFYLYVLRHIMLTLWTLQKRIIPNLAHPVLTLQIIDCKLGYEQKRNR
ncbi:hypothetical protein D3C86_1790370 [compost metagenome]